MAPGAIARLALLLRSADSAGAQPRRALLLVAFERGDQQLARHRLAEPPLSVPAPMIPGSRALKAAERERGREHPGEAWAPQGGQGLGGRRRARVLGEVVGPQMDDVQPFHTF